MNASSATARKAPSTATLILIAAAIIAIASAAVALSRGGEADQVASPHGAVSPEQPAGSIEDRIVGLEARLKQDPDNPADWRMLGWSYFETGNLMQAANAYRRAAQVEPSNAENWSSLGEALQSASD
jgi:cytochrome c-type biogenesis protein CcmH